MKDEKVIIVEQEDNLKVGRTLLIAQIAGVLAVVLVVVATVAVVTGTFLQTTIVTLRQLHLFR